MSILESASIIAAFFLVSASAVKYEFVFDNDEIFENCPKIPDNNGIHDLMDLSDMTLVFDEGRIRIFGNATCAWEGVQPTDRIELLVEFYKFQRGSWQLTPFTMSIKDYCKQQFEKSSIYYQFWTQYVAENDQKCLNNVGHVYHHQSFEVDTVFDFVINMEGRHKTVWHVNAFDKKNIRRPKSICFQVFGEFIKVK